MHPALIICVTQRIAIAIAIAVVIATATAAIATLTLTPPLSLSGADRFNLRAHEGGEEAATDKTWGSIAAAAAA